MNHYYSTCDWGGAMPANYRRLLACAVLGIDSSRSFEFSLDAAKTRLLSRIIW